MGYAGWDKQQLIDELTAENLLIGSIQPKELFDLDSEEIWKTQLTKMGKEQALMAKFPDDPSLN